MLAAFPRRTDLEQMVRVRINESLDNITQGMDLRATAFELIEWAQSQGRLRELIEGAVEENPDNPELRAFVGSATVEAPLPTLSVPPKVRQFLDFYRGSREFPAFFVGRKSALKDLDDWLDDPRAPPYLLLEAPAGMGKSALLSRWTESLSARPEIELLFFPISLRFQTNREADLYDYLLPRLGRAASLIAPSNQRELLLDALRTPPPAGTTRLVVLDGIDEAGGWTADATLVPSARPAGLRVVASARAMVRERGWRERLGWADPRLARVISLGRLTETEVIGGSAQALQAQGVAAGDDDLRRLHALSEGDPFVLWLLLVEVVGTGGAAFRALTAQTVPGLDACLDRWLHEQETLWQEQRRRSDFSPFHALLNLLACARGPLTRDDLAGLAQDDLATTPHACATALDVMHRLVVRDAGGGFSLAHVRLNWHVREERMSPGERARITERFTAWARRTLASVSRGELPPEAVPAYLLQYTIDHLDDGRVPAEDWEMLLGVRWWSAWRAHGDTLDLEYQRFVLRAWESIARRTPSVVRPFDSSPWLALELRSALLVSSIVSSHSAVPAGLLAAATTTGLLSIDEALRFAVLHQRVDALSALVSVTRDTDQERVLRSVRDLRDRHTRSRLLAEALEHVAPPRRPQLALEAFEALPEASRDTPGMSRNNVIGDVLVRVARHADEALLRALLTRLPIEGFPSADADVLHAVAQRGVLPREAFDDLLGRDADHRPYDMLLRAASWPIRGVVAVREVAEWLVGNANDRRTNYARHAFTLVKERLAPDDRAHLDALMFEPDWYPDEPQVNRPPLLDMLKAAAGESSSTSGSESAEALKAPTETFPRGESCSPERDWFSAPLEELREALRSYRRVGDADVLAGALNLPPELLGDEACALVRRIQGDAPPDTGSDRYAVEPRPLETQAALRAQRGALLRGAFDSIGVWSLRDVVARHAPDLAQDSRWQVIGAARVHHEPEVFVEVALGVAASLSPDERRPLLREAMTRVLDLHESGAPGSNRVSALGCLAELLDDDVIPEAVHIAEQIAWGAHSDWLQAELIGRLPPTTRSAHVARLLERFYLPQFCGSASEQAADMLAALAPHLSEAQHSTALERIDPTGGFPGATIRALAALTPHLDAVHLERAIDVYAQACDDEWAESFLPEMDRELCARLLTLAPDSALALWRRSLRGFARRPRRLFVRHLLTFTNFCERLGGTGTTDRLTHALVEAFARWE